MIFQKGFIYRHDSAGRHGNNEEGCMVLFSRGGGSSVHTGPIGNTQGVLTTGPAHRQWQPEEVEGGVIETLHDQYFNSLNSLD
jgi:hypothetical protein